MQTLYELLQLSFREMQTTIENSLVSDASAWQVSQTFQDEKVIPVVKALTSLFKLNTEQNAFVKVLQDTTTPELGSERLFDQLFVQLAKFVYFGNLYQVDISDLMREPQVNRIDADQNGNEMNELLSML